MTARKLAVLYPFVDTKYPFYTYDNEAFTFRKPKIGIPEKSPKRILLREDASFEIQKVFWLILYSTSREDDGMTVNKHHSDLKETEMKGDFAY